MRNNIYAQLKKSIQGEVFKSTEKLLYNFDRLSKISPLFIVKAVNLQDVINCFMVACEHKIPLSFRGAGHSFNNQSLCSGIVIQADLQEPTIKSIGNNEFEINATSLWIDIEKELNLCGRSTPVLTDYLGLSAAGTLSVGAYGIRSIKYGRQINYIKKIRITTLNGKTFWCSNHENSHLFNMSLCGLGMIGFIDKFIIETIKKITETRLLTFVHNNFTDLLKTLSVLENNIDNSLIQFDATYFKTKKNKITSRLGYTTDCSQNQLKEIIKKISSSNSQLVENRIYANYHIYNHEHVLAWHNNFGNTKKIWTDYIVGLKGLNKLLELIEDFISYDEFSIYLECVYIIGIKNDGDVKPVFLAHCNNTADIEYLLGLYFFFPEESDSKKLDYIKNFLSKCLSICVAEFGRPYLHGWHSLSSHQIDKLYGEDYLNFQQMKKLYDPQNIIKTYEDFFKMD